MTNASTAKKRRKAYADSFLINIYKVAPCINRFCRNPATCPAAHPGERARRRDIRLHAYAPVACSLAKRGEICPLAHGCPCAHNENEYWLHAMRYHTQLCQNGLSCTRTACPHAHTLEELRPLHPTLPPPEPLWSTGAWGIARKRPPPPIKTDFDFLQLQQEFEQDLWVADQAVLAFNQQQEAAAAEAAAAEAAAAEAAAAEAAAVALPQLVSHTSTDVADSRCESLVPFTPLTVVSHSPAVPAPGTQQQQGMMPPASYWVLQNNTSQLLPSAADSSLQYQLQPLEAPGVLVPAAASSSVNQLPVTVVFQPQPQQQEVQFVSTGGSQMPSAPLTGQPLAASVMTNNNMMVAATPSQVQQQLQSSTVLQQLLAAPVGNAAVDTAYNSTAAVVQAPISLAPISNAAVDPAYNSTATVLQAPMLLAPVNTTVSNTSLVNTAPISVAADSSAVINNTPVNLVMANTAAASTAPVNSALTAAMLGLSLAPSTPTLGETAAAAAAPCYLPGLQLDNAWPAGGAAAAGLDGVAFAGGHMIGDVTTGQMLSNETAGQGAWSF